VARAQADQERVIAETASATKQASATRDLDIARADYTATVKRQQAASDKAYEIEANVQQQAVVREQVAVERVAREEQIKVQDAEILRRERELIATVLKQAEIERQRVETQAAAERQRRILEAQGQAEAARVNGSGQADAIRAQGMAEADVIRARGQAEADAMHVRADAFKNYNQAAIIDKLLSSMPEVIAAISRPLSQVDKITIVSTGDGAHGMGASQVTGDITRIVAQFPALFETLTGMKVSDLMTGVTGLNLNGTTTPGATPVAPNGNGSRAIVDSTARPATPPAPADGGSTPSSNS
jgi:flotillin